jgi:chromosome segregation ATPase
MVRTTRIAVSAAISTAFVLACGSAETSSAKDCKTDECRAQKWEAAMATYEKQTADYEKSLLEYDLRVSEYEKTQRELKAEIENLRQLVQESGAQQPSSDSKH